MYLIPAFKRQRQVDLCELRYTELVLGQPGLYRETLFPKTNEQQHQKVTKDFFTIKQRYTKHMPSYGKRSQLSTFKYLVV